MNLIDLISKHPVPVTRFQRPYVIAEAGVNHEGSMDIARRLIDEAALGGASAPVGALGDGNTLHRINRRRWCGHHYGRQNRHGWR